MPSSQQLHLQKSMVGSAIGDEIACVCMNRFGTSLRAVVLHGSVARNEASVIPDRWPMTLLSDADTFVVFPDACTLPGQPDMTAAEHESEAGLAKKGLRVKVGLAAVNETFFRSLPKHIQTYELRTCGKVLCGDAAVMSLIPEFNASQISREDAWRLLCNRIVEHLESFALAGGDLSSSDVVYRTVKLYLDMATSYLVFVGKYAPTYRSRERALRHGVQDGWDAPFSLVAFSAAVSTSTVFKLDTSELSESPRVFWSNAVEFAHRLWRWELLHLCGDYASSSDAELLKQWMARQPIPARLRGWAAVVRRIGVVHAAAESRRWIHFAWKGSPRYWTYGAATQLFFQLPAILSQTSAAAGAGDWASVVSRLPAISTTSHSSDVNLLWAARMVAHNYRRFLETTAA